MYPGRPPGA
uniref:Uncharacterized protein n=1 Tax=Arundo donax TaxID=35708 RepID=A0A0A9G116_ARUDO